MRSSGNVCRRFVDLGPSRRAVSNGPGSFCPSSVARGLSATPRRAPSRTRARPRFREGRLGDRNRGAVAKRYVYCWADGIHLEARLEEQAQCILVIIGATPEVSTPERNVSAGRSKTASPRGAKCPAGRLLLHDKQDEKGIASSANVPETSSVASASVLPLPQSILRPAPAPLLNLNQCLLMLALWSCGRRAGVVQAQRQIHRAFAGSSAAPYALRQRVMLIALSIGRAEENRPEQIR